MNKYFCILPWIHLDIGHSGSCHSCCMTQNEDIGNINSDSPEKILNHPIQKKLRLNMINGEPSPQCSPCYIDEKKGAPSQRMRWNQHYLDLYPLIKNTLSDGTIKDIQLHYITLRFSNLCNLACQYCSSYYSTSIKDQFNIGLVKTFHKEEILISFLRANARKTSRYYLVGGEPLLDPLHDIFIQEISNYKPKNITLTYSSNLSHPFMKRNDLLSKWKEFKEVILYGSLDAHGIAGEKIRKNLKWELAEENIKSFNQNFGIKSFILGITISKLNILTLSDFLKYMLTQKLVLIQNIMFNFLHWPLEFKIENLSNEDRKKAQSSIENLLLWLNESYHFLERYPLEMQLSAIIRELKLEQKALVNQDILPSH